MAQNYSLIGSWKPYVLPEKFHHNRPIYIATETTQALTEYIEHEEWFNGLSGDQHLYQYIQYTFLRLAFYNQVIEVTLIPYKTPLIVFQLGLKSKDNQWLYLSLRPNDHPQKSNKKKQILQLVDEQILKSCSFFVEGLFRGPGAPKSPQMLNQQNPRAPARFDCTRKVICNWNEKKFKRYKASFQFDKSSFLEAFSVLSARLKNYCNVANESIALREICLDKSTKSEEVQFLLPLAINNQKYALAVRDTKSIYEAVAVLTTEQAAKNARLYGKIDGTWIVNESVFGNCHNSSNNSRSRPTIPRRSCNNLAARPSKKRNIF